MFNPIKRLQYKKTDFHGGGLIPSHRVKTPSNVFLASQQFYAPRRLDFRDMCIETSDQSTTPHCAGYSTAGMIEMYNWKRDHFPKQVDGAAIYNEAKDIDGDMNDGTSLDSAAQAAINLGLIQGALKFVEGDQDSIKFAVHTHSSFVAGFMITDEWNYVNKKTGAIADYGNSAQKLGGHAVLVCGYGPEGVYIQNSWGTDWGIYGFAIIPWPKVSQQFMYGMIII
jgi:hypothetical protein